MKINNFYKILITNFIDFRLLTIRLPDYLNQNVQLSNISQFLYFPIFHDHFYPANIGNLHIGLALHRN